MVSEKRKEKYRLYLERVKQKENWFNRRARKRANAQQPLVNGKVDKAKQAGAQEKLVEAEKLIVTKLARAEQLQNAKRNASERKWKHLCDSNNDLIVKNPEARCSQIPGDVRRAVELKRVRALGAGAKYFKLKPDNFHEPLQVLLTAEEAYDHIDMRKYDQKRKRIRASPIPNVKGQQLYEYDLVGMSKGQPKIIVGDTVILDNGREQIMFEIERVEGDTVVFKQESNRVKRVDVSKTLYDISFVQSGSSYNRYIKNLDEIQGSEQIQGMLFESKAALAVHVEQPPKIDLVATSNTYLTERLSKCNKPQHQAIKNILEANCRPNLYILFGPPGTGKTFTVVEAVIQIYKRNPTANILVCSGSNICVDDLASILDESEQVDKMIRLSSFVHYNTLENIPKYFTTLDRFKARSYRVVITTNMMASKLKLLYDYVFVDEAGHAHIPDTMLPMARLKADGCFILAGDPKQLGPVVKCYEVLKLGLGVSLLERMFRFKIYARRKKLGYNQIFITKLVDSYRCDPRILNLCNELFYHDELNCLGRTPPSILKMLKFDRPLVFAATKGQEASPGQSSSRQNKKEAEICLEYLFLLYKMGISPDQVGIITPYVLQRELLIDRFDKKLRAVKSMLDKRFRIKRVEEKVGVSSTTSKPVEPLGPGLHTERGLNDMAFLQKALAQLRMSAQKKPELGIKANKSLFNAIDWHCKIDTVDAFQGNEREVIIISTVRTPTGGVIANPGFLTDAKRFNVAISRAKWLVIVVGHPAVLECCKLWKKFAEHSCPSHIKF